MSARLIIGALMLAAAAFYAARGIGLPVWRDWVAGDATDIAALVFIATLLIGGRA